MQSSQLKHEALLEPVAEFHHDAAVEHRMRLAARRDKQNHRQSHSAREPDTIHVGGIALGRDGDYEVAGRFARNGDALLAQSLPDHLAKIAVERDCGRLEWAVLDWNEPAIGFYRKLGARTMDGWTTFRLDDEALIEVSKIG